MTSQIYCKGLIFLKNNILRVFLNLGTNKFYIICSPSALWEIKLVQSERETAHLLKTNLPDF